MALYPAFERIYMPEIPPGDVVIWLPFRGGDLLVQTAPGGESMVMLEDSAETRAVLTDTIPLVLGRLGGLTYVTCRAPEGLTLPPDWKPVALRSLYGQVSETEWHIAGYAAQILHWEQTSRFCPLCGNAMNGMGKEWVRLCPACGHNRYPQVSPAVLALVHDGADRILLAHKPGWGDRYSILAGFTLPGEALEECVRREVEEEVGVQVTDLVYEGSQPWPFPHQLMIGFTARYVSGEIRLDEEELDHAAWFTVGALPTLPPPLSLSRQLIDRWCRSRAGAEEAAGHSPLKKE